MNELPETLGVVGTVFRRSDSPDGLAIAGTVHVEQ